MKFFKKKIKSSDSTSLIISEREHILQDNTDFFIRESFNKLRSNITFSVTNTGSKILSVTSTNPSEGKSITAINTALSFAEINKKVLLIDSDMRRPKQHRLINTKSSPGLSNILIGECNLSDAIHKYKNIDVLCSGDIPPNSTLLLESEAFEKLIDSLKGIYDYVIIDTPPVNTVIDSCIMAKYMSGIIFVIKQNYAQKEQIVNAVRQIEFAQGKVIGFVINNITDKKLINIGKYRYKDRKYRYQNKNNSQ